MNIQNTLIRSLASQGYQARLVPVGRLRDLGQTIAKQYRQGLFDQAFYDERLSGFDFELPRELPEAQSLIIVAYADPPVRFSFYRDGKTFQLVVPPTYLHWERKDQQAQQALLALLGQAGYRVAPAAAPKKLLAACSGLAAYGKNNLTYVQGLGSFHRLAAFVSDLPCEQDPWGEPQVLERCANCQACRRACPTAAIAEGRFLLHAERCLTFLNEKPGTVAFPGWLADGSHNCLVGCMRCQSICPENRDVRDWIEEGADFSEAETELLLAGVPLTELPAGLQEKLARTDLTDLFDYLPRNLEALLANQ